MRSLGVVAGAVALVALLTGCGLAGPSEEDTASYDVTDKVNAIQIEADSGGIEVTESDRQDIHVIERLSWRKNKPVASHETQGDTLVLKFTCPGSWIGGTNCEVGYQVEIPRGLSVKATSDSGEVTLRDLSGDVDVTSDSGMIDAGGLAGKQVVSKTDSGAITLAFTAQPDKVKTSTDSGRTEVRVPEGPYNIAATTDSGTKEIDATHDASAPRSITLSSDSGAIEVLGS
ncbi:DUF4097 family beta strand repeat-containing protein [Streptosporangium lutulentum]|uniref:DUF4097 and DUF4098 domain-containing protein YvlB n=1 Tax=Streptosporangium lutulentum TaxID=1461250 RepID=A0ABT9QMH2_9ACTN|nr:DUF4097 family beta strand repeat-containing protein [Streptosporangium lutulentum]MDP9847912.1 DUF4097 and DUF4098 domain-containing protein YvlB [Streptosporangium lutulentum]